MAKKDLQKEFKALSGNEAPEEMTVKQLTESINKLKEAQGPVEPSEDKGIKTVLEGPKRVIIGWI